MYEAKTYNKRKTADLLSALDGFQECNRIVDKIRALPNLPILLLHLLDPDATNSIYPKYPETTRILESFQNAFDIRCATEEGTISPNQG